MTSAYTIRKAQPSDLDTLTAFTVEEARETEGTDPDREGVRLGVASGLEGSAPATYWVAQAVDDLIVGSISVVTEWSNFRGGYYWWIQSLFILPDHRGTGLVDLLLQSVANSARESGALDLRLYVLQSNERTAAAYRRCGFETSPYSIMTRPLE